MKKIEAIVRPEKLDEVLDELEKQGYAGVTITKVEGHGQQKGIVEQFRGKEYKLRLLPKTKIEIVVKNEDAVRITNAIAESAYTGEVGDGKIFVLEVLDAMRVRTKEKGEIVI